MIQIQTFVFNPLQENTIVAYDETREAVIVDPGCYEPEERQELDEFIAREKLTIRLLLNTHGHVDHVLGNDHIKSTYKVPFFIHPKDEQTQRSVTAYAASYGFPGYREASADKFINTGDVVSFGNTKLEVLFVPGHAPGHIAFYDRADKIIIGGDVLFHRSVGRADLPGGDFKTLIQSIHNELFSLPDDVVVYPGHGPTTTIGEEKIYNPYCALSLFRQ